MHLFAAVVPHLLQDVAAQGSNAAAGGEAADSGGSVGRFRALVDTIIGNLELKISNIHIRYEDSTSNPGHTFCIGVLLSEISAHTVGEDWQRKFVTADALLTLRKVSHACTCSSLGLPPAVVLPESASIPCLAGTAWEEWIWQCIVTSVLRCLTNHAGALCVCRVCNSSPWQCTLTVTSLL